MKLIFCALLASLTLSCATSTSISKKDCNNDWRYYDTYDGSSYYKLDLGTRKKTITDSSNNASYDGVLFDASYDLYNRDCSKIPKSTYDSIDSFVNFINEHYENLDTWTAEHREYVIDKENDPDNIDQIEKDHKSNERHYSVAFDNSNQPSKAIRELQIDLQNLKLRKSVFQELRNKFSALDKQAPKLIPLHVIKTKEWLAAEMSPSKYEDEEKSVKSDIDQQKNKIISDLADLHADQESKVRPGILKMRSENPAQWKECKVSYKTYIDFIRSKIKVNKRIPTDEQEKIGNKMKPVLEPLVICQTEGYYTEAEAGNVMGGVLCLQYFTAMPSSAKKQTECLNIMKPYSF